MIVQPTTLLASETHRVDSKHTGRTYAITVSLPLGYAKIPGEGWPFNRTPQQWPVVYVLDGNWYAAMITGMIRPMAWCGSITDAIVVGIGYVEGDDAIKAFRESFTRRNLDLTPVRDAAEEKAMEAQHKRPTPSGDAANFHRFIQTELIPLIEEMYRADPARRILVGHSYGGLFALFPCSKRPNFLNIGLWVARRLLMGIGPPFGKRKPLPPHTSHYPPMSICLWLVTRSLWTTRPLLIPCALLPSCKAVATKG